MEWNKFCTAVSISISDLTHLVGVWAPVHTPPCIKDCLTLGIWEAPMSIKPSKPLADAFMERGPVGVSE